MKSAHPEDADVKETVLNHTRTTLRSRYGQRVGTKFKPLSYTQLNKWCETAGVIKPPPGAYFSTEDIESLDLLWVSVRLIPNLGLTKYGELIREGKTLEWWIQDYLNMSLYQFLRLYATRWSNNLVFNDVVKRLKKNQNSTGKQV